MLDFTLNDGESYVDGRSEEKARELYELAEKKGIDQSRVSTTSHGYIVPSELVAKDDDAVTAEDQPAVVTEPGTTTDAEEAVNSGVEFDPATHSVAEVKEYLEGANDAERQRVLDAEANSDKPRKGLLKEGDK
jgi:hypothetical protein